MTPTDQWFYLERARQELEAAKTAVDPSAATAHRELYNRYIERAQAKSPRQIRISPQQDQ